jgi:hypothetical protein
LLGLLAKTGNAGVNETERFCEQSWLFAHRRSFWRRPNCLPQARLPWGSSMGLFLTAAFRHRLIPQV